MLRHVVYASLLHFGVESAQAFPLLLESNCYGAIGALAGLQMSAGSTSSRLGMIWIDAHGDCNTPETTLSGMPVAIAMGLCLERLRKQAGFDPPIFPRDVVMVDRHARRNADRDRKAIESEWQERETPADPARQRKIIHINMNAFFASVEQPDNPELRGKPVAVGGSHERGIIAAASYEARKFGVRSALPFVTAKRRCPNLICVMRWFDVYKAVSLQIREIFVRLPCCLGGRF